MRYGEDDWRRDAPFWAVAALFHAALLSTNPGLRWGLGKAAAPKPIPVEFVAMTALSLGQPVPGDGSANTPGFGPGEYQPEKRGPAVEAKPAPKKKAARKPAVAKAVKSKPARKAAPVRRADPAAARAALERKLEARDKAARLALAKAELARKAAADRAAAAEAARQAAAAKAAARAAALEAARQEALKKAQAEAARRAARAAKSAELSRELASMPNPDETLRDSVSGAAPSGKAARAAGAAAALAASESAYEASGDEPAYAADSIRRTGKDAYSAPASGGGVGQGGGAASFELDGPIGSRKLLKRVLPESPDWVAQRSLDLTVAIRFQVLADGTVRGGAVIAKTSGFPDLDRRALQAIRGWRFQAAKGAAPVWGSVKFRFTN